MAVSYNSVQWRHRKQNRKKKNVFEKYRQNIQNMENTQRQLDERRCIMHYTYIPRCSYIDEYLILYKDQSNKKKKKLNKQVIVLQ